MKNNFLGKTIIVSALLAMCVSCTAKEKTKQESKLTDACRQAYELYSKKGKPDMNEYMENYDLLIRDYPDFERIIPRESFENNGIFGQLMVAGMLGGMARAYAVYELNMTDEDVEKMLEEDAK